MRTVALAIVLVGAVGSLYLMFDAGRNQKSIFLIVCFTTWVVSPFIALFIANMKSKRWSIPIGITFLALALFITVGSVVSYSGAFSSLLTKPPAFKFLIVPMVSWFVIVTVISISRKISHKK